MSILRLLQGKAMDEKKTPKVFVSYSHDTPEHKQWVREFASSLREHGVEVLLDYWDLRPGDDVPKYMERSLRDSDRVLMICTPTYVVKANDGSGGVGYEAMIVTGKLVQNLGSSKFIPVLRQAAGQNGVPTSLSTRFYIDLSAHNADNRDEQFELLLRELHQAPANPKPPLGRNPFATSPSGQDLPRTYSTTPSASQSLSRDEPSSIYREALGIAKAGDLLEWRLLTQRARNLVPPALDRWRVAHEQHSPGSFDTLIQQTTEGVETFSPLFCLALAGVGSGRAGFANQAALLDEVLHPINWNQGGLEVVTALPEAAVFVYQALSGSMQLYTAQYGPAVQMIRSTVESPMRRGATPLWTSHEMIGWPRSYGHNSEFAWAALSNLPDEWSWLQTVFGDKEDFSAALVAYYLFLNVNEYAHILAKGEQATLVNDDKRIHIPINFMSATETARRRGYRLLTGNIASLSEVWHSLGVDNETFAANWTPWMALCRSWHARSRNTFDTTPMPHASLADEVIAIRPRA